MPSVARFERADLGRVSEVVADHNPRGVLARGMGRSYNDAAQNGGGRILSLLERAIRPPNPDGSIIVDASTTLDSLLRAIVPHGWFVPVTPGTRFVTIGGAVACDVHGKNHHVDGSFGAHVTQIEMILSDGSLQVFDRTSPIFFATLGGMGLTGVISRVWLQLIPIESAFIAVRTTVSQSLEETFAALDEHEAFPYNVAWLDTMASDKRLGRGVISHGRHAFVSEVVEKDAYHYAPGQLLDIPSILRWNLLTNGAVRIFNRAWHQRASLRPRDSIESIPAFFHPLDAVANWNRLYGAKGFVQHQMVVPDDNRGAIVSALRILAAGGHPSFLSVLKRLGPSSGGLLSFPMPGWTLAVDLPNRGMMTGRLLDRLDAIAVEAGGRVYLAKDSNLTPQRLAEMYPRLAEWNTIREEFDPTRVFQSDLARRLQL
jgi:decaprenylphospho-beta-D-ribofuranose 2-oxidase